MEYKRLIYGLLLSALCLLAQGQELAVESFRFTDPLPGYMMRYDLNGERASLVKVQIPLEGLIFEGDVLGGVEYSAGEYLVYMPRGSQRLRVKAPGHYPRMVTFAEENPGIPELEGARVYELRLRATAGSAPGAAAPASNYAVFAISPVHASLSIDGKQYAVSSTGDARAFLPVGAHIYNVTAPGYDGATGTVTVEASKKAQVYVNLRKQAGTLELSCPTAGAEFYVNGERAALKAIALSPGYYSVEVRAPGCAPEVRNVEVRADETTRCAFGELRKTFGSLNVDVTPIGADILIDGGARWGRSPEIFTDLPAGKHTVQISARGYTPEERTVTVSEGKTAVLSFALKKEGAATVSGAGSALEEYADIIYWDNNSKELKIWDARSGGRLHSNCFLEGAGMEIDGKYVVFSWFYSKLFPFAPNKDKNAWFSPTASEVAAFEKKIDAINRTLKKLTFNARFDPAPYFAKNVDYGDRKGRFVPVVYRGSKAAFSKSNVELSPLWAKFDVQGFNSATKRYGYVRGSKMPERMDGTGYVMRGVAIDLPGGAKVLSPGETPRRSVRGEVPDLAAGQTLLTRQVADSINANLAKVNRGLHGLVCDTIVPGVPYLINETSASTGKHLTYYFGSNGGVRAFTASKPAIVRTLLAFEPVGAEPGMRAKPGNLDLMVVRDGKYGFFSRDEWAALSAGAKKKYGIIGLAVECPTAWRVLGQYQYGEDPHSVARGFFGASLASEELMKAVGDNITGINEALEDFGFRKMWTNTPYWCATRNKTYEFEDTQYTMITNRPADFKALMRQEVMFWAKGALPQRGTFRMRLTAVDGGVRLTRYSDGAEYVLPKAVWENLPQSVKKLYGPRK